MNKAWDAVPPAVQRNILSEEPTMAHLYPVGATVICNVVAGHYAGQTDSFTVEAQMPPVGSALQYRIKSASESFRRVVAEHQLTAPDAPAHAARIVRAIAFSSEEE